MHSLTDVNCPCPGCSPLVLSQTPVKKVDESWSTFYQRWCKWMSSAGNYSKDVAKTTWMGLTHEHQTKFKKFVTGEFVQPHKDALGPLVPTSLRPKLCEHPGCCKEPVMPCATCGVDLCAQHGGLMVDGNLFLNMCLQSRCHEHTDLDICPCEDCNQPDLADIRMWKDWIGFSGCHHVGHLEITLRERSRLALRPL